MNGTARVLIALTGGVAAGKRRWRALRRAGRAGARRRRGGARGGRAGQRRAGRRWSPRSARDVLDAQGGSIARPCASACLPTRGAADAGGDHPSARAPVAARPRAGRTRRRIACWRFRCWPKTSRTTAGSNRVLLVDAPEAVQLARLIARDGIDDGAGPAHARSAGQPRRTAGDCGRRDRQQRRRGGAGRRRGELHRRYLVLAAAPPK